MEFNSQICTSREQSERLLALGLKKETADMFYFWVGVDEYRLKVDIDNNPLKYNMDSTYIPAWSLHRLIEMIPITVPDKSGIIHFFTIDGAGDMSYYYFSEESWELWKSWHQKELYDNIIDGIEWLIKGGYLNKEYLEE